jgi:hypothetical protein
MPITGFCLSTFLQCMSQFMALNRRPRHGWARQVLVEDRSRQPMIGAAVHDPERQSAPLNYRIAKGLIGRA